MLGQQLASLEELHLRLSDAAELGGEAGRALGTLGSQLRSFSLAGGSLGPGAAMQLLVGLVQVRDQCVILASPQVAISTALKMACCPLQCFRGCGLARQ